MVDTRVKSLIFLGHKEKPCPKRRGGKSDEARELLMYSSMASLSGRDKLLLEGSVEPGIRLMAQSKGW